MYYHKNSTNHMNKIGKNKDICEDCTLTTHSNQDGFLKFQCEGINDKFQSL